MNEIKELENLLIESENIEKTIFNKEYQKKEKLYEFLYFFYDFSGIVGQGIFILFFSIISLNIMINHLDFFPIFLLIWMLVSSIGIYKKKKLHLFLKNKTKVLQQYFEKFLVVKKDLIMEILVKIDKKYEQEFLKEFFLLEKEDSITMIYFLKDILEKITSIENDRQQVQEIEKKVNQVKSIYEEKEMSINQNLKYNL